MNLCEYVVMTIKTSVLGTDDVIILLCLCILLTNPGILPYQTMLMYYASITCACGFELITDLCISQWTESISQHDTCYWFPNIHFQLVIYLHIYIIGCTTATSIL